MLTDRVVPEAQEPGSITRIEFTVPLFQAGSYPRYRPGYAYELGVVVPPFEIVHGKQFADQVSPPLKITSSVDEYECAAAVPVAQDIPGACAQAFAFDVPALESFPPTESM
jgi:hypothetical protein